MKLAILSRHGKLYSTRRLVDAARARGHSVRVLDPLRCCLRVGDDGFDIHYLDKPLARFDAVLPRIGGPASRQGHAVLRQFEYMGCRTPNSSAAIAAARDKLRCHQLLAARGIAQPTTVFGDHPLDTPGLLRMLGPPPHVIKLNQGSQGAGVTLAANAHASRGAIDTLRALRADFLVQDYVAESRGADLRCVVVGDAVVSAIRRQGSLGEFRSNLHLGGVAEAATPGPEEVALAVAAAKVVGLGVAGVDLIRAERGLLVLEVNASPGLEGVEAATGEDVAGRIIEYVAALTLGPG
jgi:ribosomal protein S6--L-glutamate ligase